MRKASVSLTTVLIIGLVLILFGISVTNFTLDILDESKIYVNQSKAEVNAKTCFEEALMNIRNDNAFIGSDNILINAGTCTFSVMNDTVPNRKVIVVNGEVGSTYYTIRKKVDTTVEPLEVLNF